tara:strand:+ start:236 stop:460 length:225 start_codon:yes stop_codon:yes gene_type:complete
VWPRPRKPIGEVFGEHVQIKKLADFEDEVDFVNYMFELFIVSQRYDKTVEELNDLDVAKCKRELKKRGMRFNWL